MRGVRCSETNDSSGRAGGGAVGVGGLIGRGVTGDEGLSRCGGVRGRLDGRRCGGGFRMGAGSSMALCSPSGFLKVVTN
jgi:hypothetical protein